jgi:hypothetical protein
MLVILQWVQPQHLMVLKISEFERALFLVRQPVMLIRLLVIIVWSIIPLVFLIWRYDHLHSRIIPQEIIIQRLVLMHFHLIVLVHLILQLDSMLHLIIPLVMVMWQLVLIRYRIIPLDDNIQQSDIILCIIQLQVIIMSLCDIDLSMLIRQVMLILLLVIKH